MLILRFLFSIAVLTSSIAIRVNLQGSLSLGKEVMDTVSHYLSSNRFMARRSLSPKDDKTPDKITTMVRASNLCKGIPFCVDKYPFVNAYVIVLANALESIFEGILHPSDTRRAKAMEQQLVLFEDQLNYMLVDFKRILTQADANMVEGMQLYYWTDVVKKIGASFVDMGLSFINQRMDGDPEEVLEVKKKLTQKVVLAVAIVESKYSGRLCSEFGYCPKVMECTRSLNTLFEQLNELPDDKIRTFMKYFHESIPENVLSFLDESTANEFQIILSDMIYSEMVPTRDILRTVHKSVGSRIKTSSSGDLNKRPYDVLLIHTILSDMDHFYPSRNRVFVFDSFLVKFGVWAKSGGRFHNEINQLLKDLNKKISEQPKELVYKLTNQVKVFLELTVDT